MNYIEHKFNGKLNRLALTAGALYRIYEEKGYTENLALHLKLDEESEEGWNNCCWLYALLAAHGELQRRALGYDHELMISMEAVKTLASPADVPGIKSAIYGALKIGFMRCVEPSSEDEVDLVLKEMELNEKKKGGWRRERIAVLSVASRILRLSQKEALLLSPGELSDMIELAMPDKEVSEDWQ